MIECVRAVLLTPVDWLLLIRRTWPGGTPYWTLPGGHVEPDDLDLRAALTREVYEETASTPHILGRLLTFDDTHQRDHVYLARITSWSECSRTGPEIDDPLHGTYQLDEIPHTSAALAALPLLPEAVASFLHRTAENAEDLTTLADPTAP
ncbi:NUDIX domain-containing protein [Streptomyces sp. NPDC016845]|uniref:NUDIX domain-containing protein n=1 Tax=Streptomyces sp. NPDC016845 TaxID=3364972 RepID=UPI0037AC903B